MVNSVNRSQLSVATPSQLKSRTNSHALTVDSRNFHFSNPNPQPFENHNKGTRDLGYKAYESLVDPTDVIKFGKRVNYENKITHEELMDDHIK